MSADTGTDVSTDLAPAGEREALARYVELARSDYVSIVSYSGPSRIAPARVRAAPYAGHLVLALPVRSKTLSHIAMGLPVRCAPCDPDGGLMVDPTEIAARVMAKEELPVVRVALAAKYGWWMRVGIAMGRLRRILLPIRRTRRIGVELTVS